TVCVVGKIRDLILQLSKSSIYSTKPHAGLNKPPILARLTRSLQRRNAKIENRLDDFHRFPNNECVLTHNQVIS
ncbi:hypothetical protein MGS45_26965, partial [Klebsiella pneumoniae]|nr:hypothetical protein [Klebsiella pneumoniae]MCW6425991.1 hypothetical protein [Klebsiella pneumoniae]